MTDDERHVETTPPSVEATTSTTTSTSTSTVSECSPTTAATSSASPSAGASAITSTSTAATKFQSSLLLTDDQIVALGVPRDQAEMYRRKHYQYSFGISTWYEALKEHTFRSSFLSISYDEARAIVNKNRHNVTEAEQAIIDSLQERLELLMKTEYPGGAFMKLNTRSPKDVPLDQDLDCSDLAKSLVELLNAIPPEKRNNNSETIAFVKATGDWMKCPNSSKVIQLLVESTRVREDLSKCMDFPPALFEASITLREWIPHVPHNPHMEFRGFVYKKNLNALTQYLSFLFFPELVEQKEAIQARICAFHEEIKTRIPHESYVIDFYVTPERVMIIELNPFHSGAGASLFSWKNDREKFMNGPFEFRIVEEPITNPEEDPLLLVPAKWRNFIVQSRPDKSYCQLM
ncbi:Ras subfamily protein [Pelomyxa schiedti]|nr:Ras subfamily protein [Pelomyxa schiedti]